jgi:uncharacterized protein (TIGR03905 family)
MTIEIDDNGIITNVVIVGGCHGNTQGVSRLLIGMNIEEAIKRLKGIDCRGRGTSCPDQLAIGMEKMLEQIKNRA